MDIIFMEVKMKTASLVLGIIGAAFAIIVAIVFLAGGAFLGAASNVVNNMDEQLGDIIAESTDGDVRVDIDLDGLGEVTGAAADLVSVWAYVWCGLSVVGAVLGIIGAVKVNKNNVTAGVLMLVAAVPSFFTGVGIIASILFIIGGILALVSGKSAPAAA